MDIKDKILLYIVIDSYEKVSLDTVLKRKHIRI